MRRSTARKVYSAFALLTVLCVLQLAWILAPGTRFWWCYGEKVELNLADFKVRRSNVVFGVKTGTRIEGTFLSSLFPADRGSDDWMLLYVTKRGIVTPSERVTSSYKRYIAASNWIAGADRSMSKEYVREWIVFGTIPPNAKAK